MESGELTWGGSAPGPTASPPRASPPTPGPVAAGFFRAPSDATVTPPTDAAGDAVHRVAAIRDPKFLPDRFNPRALAEELPDGLFANRQHQRRAQPLKRPLQAGRAIRDFLWRGHPVAAARTLARKTATPRRKVDPVSRLLLRPTERIVQPSEKRASRRPRERPAELRLLVPRRLTAPHNATHGRAPGDGRPMAGRCMRGHHSRARRAARWLSRSARGTLAGMKKRGPFGPRLSVSGETRAGKPGHLVIAIRRLSDGRGSG